MATQKKMIRESTLCMLVPTKRDILNIPPWDKTAMDSTKELMSISTTIREKKKLWMSSKAYALVLKRIEVTALKFAMSHLMVVH